MKGELNATALKLLYPLTVTGMGREYMGMVLFIGRFDVDYADASRDSFVVLYLTHATRVV